MRLVEMSGLIFCEVVFLVSAICLASSSGVFLGSPAICEMEGVWDMPDSLMGLSELMECLREEDMFSAVLFMKWSFKGVDAA